MNYYTWNYKKLLCNIATAAGAVLLAWLLLSYLEIISKNIFGGATYSEYNIITNTLYYLGIIW